MGDMVPPEEMKFIGLDLKGLSETGAFAGYASVFGAVDLGKDVITPGAFEKSLKLRGAGGVRMLFQHDPSTPIGRWTEIREDERGLYVEGKLAKGVAKADEVLNLMRSRALDGLSWLPNASFEEGCQGWCKADFGGRPLGDLCCDISHVASGSRERGKGIWLGR